MKRILIQTLIFTSVLFLLVSCPTPTPGGAAGSLTVSFNAASLPNRSILPDIDMNPAGFVITGAGPGGASFQVETTALSATVANLAFGTWTVAVEAENADGVVIGRGEGTVVVHTGQSASLTIIVRPLDGYGTLDLTVNWNAADTDNPGIDATLTPYLGGTQVLDFTITNGNQGRYHNENVPTGYHTLIVKLLDNGLLTMGAVEVVRIVQGGTATGVFDFTEINKPGGGITIGVTPEMDEPLEVSMSGQAAELSQGQTMTVSASVANDPGNVVYVWYVNGDAIGTGSVITFGSALPVGVYRLDVAAFTADGRRGGSASAMFHVVTSSGYRVIYHDNGSTGGNVPADNTIYLPNSIVVVFENTGSLVNPGQQFAGWNTQVDLAGTSYAAGAQFPIGYSDIHLYPVWIPDNLQFESDNTTIAITGYIAKPTGDLVIPGGVTEIGVNAFQGCIEMTSVSFPATLLHIRLGAFTSCYGITVLAFPNRLLDIGLQAFYWCTGLSGEITLPASLSSIYGNSFHECTNLTAINVDPANPFFRSESGVMFSADGTVLVICPNGRSGSYVVPMGVRRIRADAFMYCSKLTDISLPSGIEVIEIAAFMNCSGLTHITLPSSLISIESSAFYGCTGIMEVSIPSEVSDIGMMVFSNCTQLQDIFVDPANMHYQSISGVLFDKAGTTLLRVPGARTGSFLIPEGVTVIARESVSRLPSLTSVVIPQSVMTIEQDAFVFCSALANVAVLSPTPPALDPSAFHSCANNFYIHVPSADLVDDYQGATGWSDYASSIVYP